MDDILDILVRIQHCDEDITTMRTELDLIPKKITKLESEMSNASTKLNEKKQRLGDLKKDYKLREGDIAANEEKMIKLNSQTFAVKTNDEYRALLNEVEFLKQENKKIEVAMISILEEEEMLKSSIDKHESETKDFIGQKNIDIAALNKRKHDLEEKIKIAEDKYNDDFLKLPKETQNMYDKIKAVRGKAVCLINSETCTGCYSNITPQFLNELKKRNEILLCDNCGRILIYVNDEQS